MKKKLVLALCLAVIAVPAQARNAEDYWCGKGKDKIHLMMWIAKMQEPMRDDEGKLIRDNEGNLEWARAADGRTYSQYGIINHKLPDNHPKWVTVVPDRWIRFDTEDNIYFHGQKCTVFTEKDQDKYGVGYYGPRWDLRFPHIKGKTPQVTKPAEPRVSEDLPNMMLGEWCRDNTASQTGRQVYTRGTCDRNSTKLNLNRNGYKGQIPGGEDYGCDFKSVKLSRDGSYLVHAECGGEGGLSAQDMVFQNEDKQLVMRTITSRFCVSVIQPSPEVVKNPEYNEDKWLALREGPGPQFKLITKLGGYEHLEADDTKGDWTHISNVTRLSSTENSPQIVQGWVRSKYVKKFPCENETADEQKSGTIRPEEKDAEWCRNHDHQDVACIWEQDPNNPGFSKPHK